MKSRIPVKSDSALDLRLVFPLLLAFCILFFPWAQEILRENESSEQQEYAQSIDNRQKHNDILAKGTSPKEKVVFTFAPVPINSADFELLQTIKGVGPQLAQEIIAYRQKSGKFMSPQSLRDLKGVGEGRFRYLSTQFSFE